MGGVTVADDYPELDNTLLVCATETKTGEDLEAFAGHLERIFARLRSVACPVAPRL